MSRPDHAVFCNKDHAPGTTPCARIVPATVLGARELLALKPGATVSDTTGDVWEKAKDGLWTCFDATMITESLLHVWGPITLVKEQP